MVDFQSNLNVDNVEGMIKNTAASDSLCPPTSDWEYYDIIAAKPTVQTVGEAPGAGQAVTGIKTFAKDIEITNLDTQSKAISSPDSKIWQSSTHFNDAEYVLRSERSLTNIASNLQFSEKVTIDSFDATSDDVTWDGVSMNKFFNNLLDNSRAQTITGDLSVRNDLTISSGLIKDATVENAVNTINNVDIVSINSKALTIDDSQGLTTLGDVSFDEVAITDQDGLLMEENAKFLGVDISKTAVTVNGPLTMANGKVRYKGGIEATGDISLTGKLRNEDATVTVNQDELWNFLKNDATVTKVKVSHADGATAASEPSLTNVNSKSLTSLRTNHWHQGDTVSLPYNLQFADVEVSAAGKLKTTHLDSTTSLKTIRDTYLSKGTTQTITADYTFDNAISFSAPLSVDTVSIKDDQGNEGTLETGAFEEGTWVPSVSQSFKARHDSVNSKYFTFQFYLPSPILWYLGFDEGWQLRLHWSHSQARQGGCSQECGHLQQDQQRQPLH